MTHPLISFICREQDRSIEGAHSQLSHGLTLIDPPAYDHPLRLDHVCGQCQYIAGVHLQDIKSRRLAGWVAEHNDCRDAVIALRQSTARGA